MATVLVIDDDQQIRAMLQRAIGQAGHTVIEAADGNRGLALYDPAAVDLVITDLIMPDKEGIETIMELHRRYPDVKVIAISGGGRSGPVSYLNTARHLGAFSAFRKPIRIPDLLTSIEEGLSSAAPGGGATTLHFPTGDNGNQGDGGSAARS